MKKYIYILISALLLATNISAKTITVTSGGDSGAETLHQAVADANDGDIIVIADNVTTVTFQSRIDIYKKITICGNENSTTTFVTGEPWDYTTGAGRRQLFLIGATADVMLRNLTMTGVAGNCSGSAIANYGKCTIDFCTFVGNSNGTNGTGGAIESQGDLYITNSLFHTNKSNHSGGAIDIADGTATIINSVFYNNTANGSGGAIIISSAYLHDVWTHPVVSIYNSTFVNNRSIGNPWDGHAISNWGTLNLYNSVIWSVNSDGKIVQTYRDAVTNAYYSLIGNQGTSFGGVFVDGGGNIFGENPLFYASYTLQAESPAIDKGSNDYLPEISEDIMGNLRISNGTVDMGAYEFQHNFAVTFAGEEIAIDQQTIRNGNLATRPENPTREDYIFGGWFTDNGTFFNEWDFAANIVMQNTTLYAKWISQTAQPEKYTVSFSGEEIAIDRQEIEHGNPVLRPENPTREGYAFAGWFTEPACENEWDFATHTVTAHTTLYAKWILHTETGVETVQAPSVQPVAYYNLLGQKLKEEPEHGIFLVKYADGRVEKVFK
ncbi:MAG: InlB B-repeat-containing protein [Bacteroidales bacterium]|jgi:uncharacterized repeat protein (TIGR02543 family)|nr:InlB B-repeat-containing protein [Bacteroidales bacterium]